MLLLSCVDEVWPLWKKILFRFFFIYLILLIMPFQFLSEVTTLEFISKAYDAVNDPLVRFFNDHLFHIADPLVPINGSSDTSFGWTQLCMHLFLAAAGTLIWSLADRKRKNYAGADYWICIGVRYYISYVAFLYGILKLFAMQMMFPSLTQMAIPVGDYLPMRFSWIFIGYSTPYQVFSGIMEVMVGLLLLWRRTATLGTVTAFAVFFNVMMLNLCYDIPVKIFSMNMVMLCLFLLVHERQRIHAFFIMNREAAKCNIYDAVFTERSMRIGRVMLKTVFIILAVGGITYEYYGWWKESKTPQHITVLKPGMYEADYLSSSDSIAPNKKWRDMIIEPGDRLSVKQNDSDTLFDNRYARTFMSFKTDSLHQLLLLSRRPDSDTVYSLRYEIKDSSGFVLRGRMHGDSVAIMFTKSTHHFQLADRPFHWLSEGNR